MARKFEIMNDKTGKIRFNLLAANEEIIATSEAYESKEACKNRIQSLKANAPTASIVDKTM